MGVIPAAAPQWPVGDLTRRGRRPMSSALVPDVASGILGTRVTRTALGAGFPSAAGLDSGAGDRRRRERRWRPTAGVEIESRCDTDWYERQCEEVVTGCSMLFLLAVSRADPGLMGIVVLRG